MPTKHTKILPLWFVVGVPQFSLPLRVIQTHLPELAFSQLLSEQQALSRELGHRNVLPCEGVDGEGRNGVHVAPGDPLKAYDVCFSVVGHTALKTLMGGAQGNIGLGVPSAAG